MMKRKVLGEWFTVAHQRAKRHAIARKVEAQHNEMQINYSFLRWIERFNKKQLSRKKKFAAASHWMQATMRKNLYRWAQIVRAKALFRHRVTQVVPMRCLTSMLDLEHLKQRTSFPGQELQMVDQAVQMKSMDQYQVRVSVDMFQYNMKREVFGVFRDNYHKMCSFKARQAMSIAHNAITEWKKITTRRAVNRYKVETMNQKHKRQTKMNVLKAMRQSGRKRSTLRSKSRELTSKTR